MAERGTDPATAVRHLVQAVPRLPGAVERAAALAGLAPSMLCPTVLGSGTRQAAELLHRAAAELAALPTSPDHDGELSLRLAALLHYADSGTPHGLRTALTRLAELGPQPLVSTPGERALLCALLHAATLGSARPAAEIAELTALVLDREPALPWHVHSLLPLATVALVAADAAEPLVGWLETARAHAEDRAAAAESALIEAERTLVLLSLGRVTEAGQALGAALAPVGRGQQPTGLSVLALAALALETRDPALLRRVPPQPEPVACSGPAAAGRLLDGLRAACAGDREVALERFLSCGEELERVGWRNPVLFPWRPWAAVLHQKLGNPSAAVQLAEEEYARCTQWGAASAVGRALRLRGLLAEGPHGLALLREAVAVLEQSGHRLELARTLLLLGRRLQAAGLREGADLGRRGRRLALDCGAPWLADRPTAPRSPAPPATGAVPAAGAPAGAGRGGMNPTKQRGVRLVA
ncbi:LuxR family transcriptional regulator, partial [Kitasatospora sp. LaBMicrA B282]